MLSTIVMTLLAIWLSLLIVGQVIGGYVVISSLKPLPTKKRISNDTIQYVIIFVLLNLGVVLMVHYSVWIGLAICIVSGIRFLRDIELSKNLKVIIPSENNLYRKEIKCQINNKNVCTIH